MDLRALTYFVTVAEERNITHAAEKLNMSQPPLSTRIRQLEEELGTDLFIREKHALQLTDAGTLLLRRATQILEMTEKAKSEIVELGKGLTGTLFLGMVEGKAPFIAAEWIAGFLEEFPNVRFELFNGSGDDVLERLRKGMADLAVICAPYDTEWFEGFTVGTEPWVAMIPVTDPLAINKSPIKVSELSGKPLIVPRRKSRVEAIRKWFSDAGSELCIICEQSNYLDAVALTQAGVGISIFPQTTDVPNPHFVTRVITDPMKMAEYVLVWPKNRQFSEATEAFVDFIRDIQCSKTQDEKPEDGIKSL